MVKEREGANSSTPVAQLTKSMVLKVLDIEETQKEKNQWLGLRFSQTCEKGNVGRCKKKSLSGFRWTRYFVVSLI